MPEDLYRLVYVSRNDITGDTGAVRREVDQILATSRRNNARAGVTGALMFNHGCFAQALEGPHDALQGVFERIQCDPRHSRVVVLAFEPVAQPAFAEWSMAYVGADPGALEEFSDLHLAGGLTTDPLAAERVFRLLHDHLREADYVRAS